ncbi:unnamed protein product [Ilex paraguariensis]|uniref:Uncharacterized protein n=1 Tax=Ilex paraguariensis TaxID=185542 RepID=A0ABC8URE4_9AQUA
MTTQVTIPYGNSTEFSIIGSEGVERLLRVDDSTNVRCFSCDDDIQFLNCLEILLFHVEFGVRNWCQNGFGIYLGGFTAQISHSTMGWFRVVLVIVQLMVVAAVALHLEAGKCPNLVSVLSKQASKSVVVENNKKIMAGLH